MNIASFDLNLLRVLDALLREQSTVRAGERLGLSQPAVSAALARLRHALGDELFVRQGQRFVPTDHARSLEFRLRELLDEAESMLAGPVTFDPMRADFRFRIAGTDFFADMLMPELADIIARYAPGIRLQLIDLVPGDYVETLDRHEVDLALCPRAQFPGWTEHQPVFHSTFMMIARKGHPRLARAGLSPGETVPMDLFCDLGHVLFSPEGNLRAMGDAALDRVGRQRRVVMTVPVFSGVARAVSASDLVALFPRQMAHALADQFGFAVYRTPVDVAVPLLCMVWHRRTSRNPGQQWVRARIAGILGRLNEGEAPLPQTRKPS